MTKQFENLDNRIQILKEIETASFSKEIIALRRKNFKDNIVENNNNPKTLQIALGMSKFLDNKQIFVNKSDELLGHIQFCDASDSIPIVLHGDIQPLVCPSVEFDIDRQISQLQKDKTIDGDDLKMLKDFSAGANIKLYKHWSCGHVIAGYHNVLKYGVSGHINKIKDAIKNNPKNATYLESSLLVCEAFQRYILRYADKAIEESKHIESKEDKQRLMKIGKACEHIAYDTPNSFFEAVQLFWFTHEVIVFENFNFSLSLGRLDQYLYPYYKSDLEKGKIDINDAYLLIEALWIKFSNTVESYQNVTLGGMDKDGEWAGNEISLMCMRATKRLKMDQPLISVRWNDKMPEAFWKEVQELIEVGIGFPALINDEIAIKAKKNVGVEEKDAKDYGIVGCVELSIPGSEYSNTESLRINWAKILELMMNNGECVFTKEKMPMCENKDLSSIHLYEEFYKWYKKEFINLVKMGMDSVNLLDSNYASNWPNQFLSLTMDGCIENGRDATGGGTKYNNSVANACGVANVANSLYAIKRNVFEDKIVSLNELSKAMKQDYKGYQLLQNRMKSVSKFGNDIIEVDEIAKDLTHTFCDVVLGYDNPRGGKFQPGLYTVSDHSMMGKYTGATPDGRNSRVALANALSGSQGTETNGPTALITSVLQMDHTMFANGMVLDLKFQPQFFDSDRHKKAFKSMIKTYFKQGGMEIQFNVIDSKTLVKAQKTPEDFKNLVVRVSGFSAYFVTLDKTLQDEIIKRTEFMNF